MVGSALRADRNVESVPKQFRSIAARAEREPYHLKWSGRGVAVRHPQTCDIANFFGQSNQPFDTETFTKLYDRFDGVTWYVQRVLNRLWAIGAGLTDVRQIDDAVNELVEDRSLVFRDLLGSQNDISQKLLPAIAREGIVNEPTAAAFLAKYGLCASSVRSALADLCERDIVYRFEKGYIIYERLFGEWLKANG